MLPMVWVELKGIQEMKFTGFDIRTRILNQNQLDIEMADALVCLLREHEAETLFIRANNPGRHWAISVLTGATCCPDISFNQFMFPTPRYDIRRCQIVLTLVCLKGEWYCYAFDLARCIVSIMDPILREPIPPSKIETYRDNAYKLVTHVVCCMRLATGDKSLGSGTWTPKLMLGRGRASSFVNSGIDAINCMRWYNGNIVCTPPKDVSRATSSFIPKFECKVLEQCSSHLDVVITLQRFAINTRKDLTLQLISMSSNTSTTPVLRIALSARKQAQAWQSKKQRRDAYAQAMGSNSGSTGPAADGNSSESSSK
ncbi:hypothetical protein C2845_PM13G19810 [Panicum miliaceum]|uniref:Uncharacterized protein n=1 Tax=Panicum miliaceum TaxID=4540 RepID=A0A3L6RKB4_PANMI|nr:hypothetical protein C2845_PM13G19810 [Panicum miliaceum]